MGPQFTLNMHSSADTESVYELLEDLSSHLEWNGELQAKNFRLLSLNAPNPPAVQGTEFSSEGSIPFSKHVWRDKSIVTVAEKPRVFEFRTEGEVELGGRSPMKATLLHHYEILAEPVGCSISYTMKQDSLSNGMWRISWPILRTLTWKVGIPLATRPGLRNLARLAEVRAAAKSKTIPSA